MTWHAVVTFAPLIAMLMWAAYEDLRRRRIPNWLTLTIALTGLMQSFTAYPTVRPWQSVCGLAAGLGLTIALFALGALGGGDVKLLAAAGAWTGAALVLYVFLATAVIGMVIVLSQSICQRRVRVLLRNSLLLVVNLLHVKQLGVEHTRATGQSCRSIDRPLPYAVPVLIATAAVLLFGRGGA